MKWHYSCTNFQISQLFKHLQIILQRLNQYTSPKPSSNLTAILVYHVAELLYSNTLIKYCGVKKWHSISLEI